MNIITFIKTWDLKLAKDSFISAEQLSHAAIWYKQHHVDGMEAVGTVHAEQSGLRVSTTNKSHRLPAEGDKKRQTNERFYIASHSSSVLILHRGHLTIMAEPVSQHSRYEIVICHLKQNRPIQDF